MQNGEAGAAVAQPVERERPSRRSRRLPMSREAGAQREVLRCYGEIDVSNVGWLEQELTECVEAGVPALELDLSSVTFVDSLALRAIVMAYWKMAAGGRPLTVRAHGVIAGLFRTTQLDAILQD